MNLKPTLPHAQLLVSSWMAQQALQGPETPPFLVPRSACLPGRCRCLALATSDQGCSNRESRESRVAKKRRFAPNREVLNKIPNRPNRYLMTTAV